MKSAEFAKMAEQELSHWWYEARRSFLRRTLAKMPDAGSEAKILDLASACGGNFPVCREFGMPVGLDISEVSVQYCSGRDGAVMVMGDAEKLPFDGESFDAVIAFDIFEHLEKDCDSMKEVNRVLKADHTLLVNLPACKALFSEHDRAFDHVRRYSRAELREKLEAAGFDVVTISYWSFFIFPAVFAARKLIKSKKDGQGMPKSDFHYSLPGIVNWTMGLLSSIEIAMIDRGFSFPWGVSLYATCLKRVDGDSVSA